MCQKCYWLDRKLCTMQTQTHFCRLCEDEVWHLSVCILGSIHGIGYRPWAGLLFSRLLQLRSRVSFMYSKLGCICYRLGFYISDAFFSFLEDQVCNFCPQYSSPVSLCLSPVSFVFFIIFDHLSIYLLSLFQFSQLMMIKHLSTKRSNQKNRDRLSMWF